MLLLDVNHGAITYVQILIGELTDRVVAIRFVHGLDESQAFQVVNEDFIECDIVYP